MNARMSEIAEQYGIARGTDGARRVVVTGLGIVAGSGTGPDALWEHLLAGRSATRPVSRFDAGDHAVWVAAEIPDFRPRDFMTAAKARGAGRFCQLAVAAARIAVDDARMPASSLASARAGFFLGTAMGPVGVSEEQAALYHERGPRSVERSFAFCASPHSASTLAASDYGVGGPVTSVCSECPAGLDAIAAAWDRLHRGELDVALAGGADAPLSPMLFTAYARAGVLASDPGPPESAGRPFDRRRSGFVLGEGGAILALETLEHARARGARVYGELAGFGYGRDRPTFVASADPAGDGILAAALGALEASHLAPFDLECVSAHATGLRSTDLAEMRALRTLLGARRRAIPVTSIKGAVGHPLAAAGVLQLATGLLALSHDTVPATRNCDDLDPECDLDIVRHAPRRCPVNTVLTTTHGFGGSTTAVVARRVG